MSPWYMYISNIKSCLELSNTFLFHTLYKFNSHKHILTKCSVCFIFGFPSPLLIYTIAF